MADSSPRQAARAAPRRRRYPLRRLVRANFYDLLLLLRESWVALAAFWLLASVGSLYLRFGYGGPGRPSNLAAAFFETLKLVTLQTGYILPDDLLGAALFFLIPLLGLALIFQSVLNFSRLLLDKGSRREAWQVALASTYSDHVIVVGLGRVGLRVISQLIEAGYEPVAVERNWGSQFVERVLGQKVPVVLGDARELATLRQAGLPRARAVISCIGDDLLNIEVALAARKLRPDARVILRVFSEELDHNLERSFGHNSAFSTSSLAAPTFAAAAVSREIDYVLPFDGQLLGVTQIEVQPDSAMSGFVRQIEESQHLRVLHHQNPQGRHLRRDSLRQLNSGDRVTLLGSLPALETLRQKNQRGSKLGFLKPAPLQHPTSQFDTVIVCGLGKVGYRVVQQLHQLRPRPRIVVVRREGDAVDFAQRIAQLEGIAMIPGDARDVEVLRRAGIERCYTVAALTSNDLFNLQIGLAARRARADVHVVLRVFSDVLAERLADMFGIRTIYSTSDLAGATLAAAGLIGQISHAFYIGDHLFSTASTMVCAGDPLDGQTIEAVRVRLGALVIGLRRAGAATALPALDGVLAPGDEVALLATIETLARIRPLLCAQPPTEAAPAG